MKRGKIPNFKIGILPSDPEDRIKYLYRLEELLKIYFNKKGQEYKEGKLDAGQFRYFKDKWFYPRSIAINKEINRCRKNIKAFQDYYKLSEEQQKEIEDDLEKNPLRKYKLAKKDTTIEVTSDCFEAN